jgi:hypothetical protein
MRVALITEAALNRRHGTGAQLLRYLDGLCIDYTHTFFIGWSGWRSETPNSLCLAQPEWLEHHHRVRSLARRLGLYWWRYGGLRRSTREAIRAHATPCDVAWVVVGGEKGAKVVRRIIAELRVPVLLHMMDLYADSLDTCPHLRKLAAEAAEIIALTPTIAGEIKRATGRDSLLIGVGHALDVPLARPPGADGWDMLITGRIYPDSLRLLAAALRLLPPSVRPRAIRYPGPAYADIPDALRDQVVNLGFIEDPVAYAREIASHHVAYLQLPVRLDNFGRYSYPSRATDYLMAGLPVVGHTPRGSAAAAALHEAYPGVRLSHGGAEELAADIASVTANRETWLLAHRAARNFAEHHIDLVPQREAIRAALHRAAFNVDRGSAPR